MEDRERIQESRTVLIGKLRRALQFSGSLSEPEIDEVVKLDDSELAQYRDQLTDLNEKDLNDLLDRDRPKGPAMIEINRSQQSRIDKTKNIIGILDQITGKSE